jgi:hypothetical protein
MDDNVADAALSSPHLKALLDLEATLGREQAITKSEPAKVCSAPACL